MAEQDTRRSGPGGTLEIPPYGVNEIAQSARHALRIRGEESPIPTIHGLPQGMTIAGEPGLPFVGRYAGVVMDLVRDPERLGHFLEALHDYERVWNTAGVVADFQPTGEQLMDMIALLRKLPGVRESEGSRFETPVAALFDACNRSPIGLYGQSTPAVTAEGDSHNTNFITLVGLPEWRRTIALHAERMAVRFRNMDVNMDVVMIGDGSGQLGADIASHLESQGWNGKIVHIDLSTAMLGVQRERYIAAGIPAERVVSIRGSALEVDRLIAEHSPTSQGAFFALHEVFDDLRSHLLNITPDGIEEVHLRIDAEQKTLAMEGGPVSHPILGDLADTLPQLIAEPRGNMRTFSPESIAFLQKVLNSCPHAAVYVGDYASCFSHGNFLPTPNSITPVRFHPMCRDPRQAFHMPFFLPMSVTADFFPGLLHFAEAFGGRVEALTDQLELRRMVDPGGAKDVLAEVRQMQLGLGSQEEIPWSDASRQLLRINLADPTFLAALVTKGLDSASV